MSSSRNCGNILTSDVAPGQVGGVAEEAPVLLGRVAGGIGRARLVAVLGEVERQPRLQAPRGAQLGEQRRSAGRARRSAPGRSPRLRAPGSVYSEYGWWAKPSARRGLKSLHSRRRSGLRRLSTHASSRVKRRGPMFDRAPRPGQAERGQAADQDAVAEAHRLDLLVGGLVHPAVVVRRGGHPARAVAPPLGLEERGVVGLVPGRPQPHGRQEGAAASAGRESRRRSARPPPG